MTGGMVGKGMAPSGAAPTFHGVSQGVPAVQSAPAHVPAPPFAHASGPTKFVRIAIVGEAWGDQEELFGKPFVGASGQELTRILGEAGINRRDCFITTAFTFRPPSKNLELICAPKAEVGKDYPLAPLRTGKYIKPEFLGELDRLRQELEEVRPNVVLALGNAACWALLGTSGINSLRGTVAESSLVPGLKVIASYNPGAILAQWALRPILVVDLMKALRESEFPEIRRPERWVLVDPDLQEIEAWIEAHAMSAPYLAVDIETKNRQITCIGFGAGPRHALVIPFWDRNKLDQSYWADAESEVLAWGHVRRLLGLPCPKVYQNGMYDLQYIWKMGIVSRCSTEDTMLRHHAFYPELQKGLGFLGSVYTNESAWKLLNRRRSDEVEKKDE